MNGATWSFSEDLPLWFVVAVMVGVAVGVVLLLAELRTRERAGVAVAATGVVAALALGLAVLRPVTIDSRGSVVGAKVLVLVDQSRRLELPADDGGTRRAAAQRAVAELRKRFATTRLDVYGFGDDELVPLATDESPPARAVDSDLLGALSLARERATEAPRAVVVVSDGRLTRPAAEATEAALQQALGAAGVALHTVAVAQRARPDAAVRQVRVAGAAVAHQPLAITIELACVGGLTCGALPVRVRELRSDSGPALLASGKATFVGDTAVVELRITLERAGARVVEVAIDAPPGDTIPDNDRRFVTFEVARDRLRLLHVAGRPTYDVRALRMWLKSDASVDLVAFFILRTLTDDSVADESELALIPFPVDELFTEHLPSFDAVILQDIDAVAYKLARHLDGLAKYVETGGGLIMVGGEASFVGGQYAGTALDRVLPVTMPEATDEYFDVAEFVPRFTAAGRAAPILGGLRDLFGDELPAFPGVNIVGSARPGAIVLLEHPTLEAGARPLPVLAIGEAGDGRAVALGVDGTHRLAFSELAADVGGRGYGALWDGLLGWLMRDPRYEPAQVKLKAPCLAGVPTVLEVLTIPGMEGDVEVELRRMGEEGAAPRTTTVKGAPAGRVEVDVGKLEPGGYVVRARVGAAPPTRHDFACERGGAAWADSRPDPERLARIAEATGGRAVTVDRVGELTLPEATRVTAERHVAPLLPAWVLSLAAAVALGLHWLARRRGGLA